MIKPTPLRAWKFRHNLTHARIARKLGFSVSYVAQVTAGRLKISEHFKHRFIAVYGREAALEAGLLTADAQ